MRTILLREVLDDICLEWQQQPFDSLNAELKQSLQAKLNTAYELAWEYHDWPETLSLTERTLENNLIPHEQAGEVIALMLEVYDRDPRPTFRVPKCDYTETANGWLLCRARTAPVWCEYQRAAETYGLLPHVPATVYPAGSRVYAGGQSYRALQEVAANTPLTSDQHWRVVPFLALLRTAVAAGVIGALTRQQGQSQTGEVRIGEMSAILDGKILNLNDRSGRIRRIFRS